MSGPHEPGEGPEGHATDSGAEPPTVAKTETPDAAYTPDHAPPPADPARDSAGVGEVPPAAFYPAAPAAPPPLDPFAPMEAPIFRSGPASYLPVAPPVAGVTDEPLLPPALATAGALQDAVGAPSARARRRARARPGIDGELDGDSGGDPEGDDEGDDERAPRGRRAMVVGSFALAIGLAIATLVFLGHANAQRYLLACDATHAVAERGRGFPPWGTRPMAGAEWAPVSIPANAECQPRETEDPGELAKWYVTVIVDRATVTLTSRDLLDAVGNQAVANPLDAVAAQLDQALLLARDPDRRDQRKEIARLQGDVEYWRAAARLREASAILLDAARQFDSANQHHPRHVTDAAAWSGFVHRLADELKGGPSGVPSPSAPTTSPTNASATEPAIPAGTEVPVEPASGGSAIAPPALDAGLPAGGVLL